ncbi:MAG: ribosome maturation factor RimM [Solirubrobacteraceae bacterium]
MTPGVGPEWLRAGTVGRAHGLDGSFHVGRIEQPVMAVVQVGSEVQVAGSLRRVTRLAGHSARPIVRLEGCDRREDAEALNGTELMVARADIAELEPDEWWAVDLEGCAVYDGERPVGVVSALLALPSCEVLEVERRSGDDTGATADDGGAATAQPLLVPLVRDAVRSVDIDRRVIDVDLRFLGEDG